MAKLALVDQELDVAVLTSTDEYWGHIYGKASANESGVERIQTDGPKCGYSADCFVIRG